MSGLLSPAPGTVIIDGGCRQVIQWCNCSIPDYDARLMTSIRPTQKVVSNWEIVIRDGPVTPADR